MSKLYSPPNRAYPQELPDYWKFEDGTIHTDLQELSDVELEALGWYGPITLPEEIPNTSNFTHNYTWNPNTLSFDAEEIDQYEKERRVDYKGFWQLLLTGDIPGNIENTGAVAYKKIKDAAKLSLEVNTIVTEFIALITDAKYGNPDMPKIQESFSQILLSISFTDEELMEIQQIFTKSGMFAVYTLA
jgi:hypothetical protein